MYKNVYTSAVKDGKDVRTYYKGDRIGVAEMKSFMTLIWICCIWLDKIKYTEIR
jgi:hypothetical protein